MLIIKDNLLEPHLIPESSPRIGQHFIDPGTNEDVVLDAMWNIAAIHFDLSNVKTIEKWSHDERSIGTVSWHLDEDVAYKKETGISRLPQCTMIYYPKVSDDLIGGWLCTKTQKIKPVSNRAVIFDSRILHTVEPAKGQRFSIIYNPWNHLINLWIPGYTDTIIQGPIA